MIINKVIEVRRLDGKTHETRATGVASAKAGAAKAGAAKLWDAIVVGAGPAGCAAAYELAVAGRTVLLLDRCDFPRPKACAGGLTMKTVRALRYSVKPVTRELVHRILLEKNGGGSTLVKTRDPICVMTVRAELDAYCLRQTLVAGAQFEKIPGIKTIDTQGDRLVIDTGAGLLQAQFLVGADGVNSRVRQFCAGAGKVAKGFALEAQVPMPANPVDLTFDFGAIRNGYGWIFPKGDHLNIGLGYYTGRGEDALNRERLLAYIRLRLGTDAADHVVGQFLGIADTDAPFDFGRILLAGDAAGLVDPLTGEGIYGAVISGQAAARAIDSALGESPRHEADPEAEIETARTIYREAMAPLREVLAFSTRAAGSFYANPDRGFQALTLPGLRGALLKTYAHGLSSGMLMRILQRRRAASQPAA